ncbi:hypothetical protein [Paenibacillus mendelii]|uniref:Uncharacterized protein n=1 Tax=Paenibacillus mendelii TaxID=206163 RepID=A0ABV6J529_9BACL|nr:hypothetical protein [Paenibacillus mendelii]MCQ6560306.1 hypothetical protein [Paenibacillus mendelii]
MDDRKQILLQKLIAAGIANDPQWLERLDEPAPLWVVLELMLQLIERYTPPYQPYD